MNESQKESFDELQNDSQEPNMQAESQESRARSLKDSRFVNMFPALRHLNIPNAITTLGLLFGIAGCFLLMHGELRFAILVLFFCGVTDGIDGFVAAKLNQQTEFGQYVDTLVDFFVCGIVPIVMVFGLLVQPYETFNNIIIVVGLGFYCMCALWRLAYYNIVEADKYFVGLPVPGSMMLLTMAIWSVATEAVGFPMWVAAVAFLILGTLMISGIKLKKYGWWQKCMGVISLASLVLVIFVH